MTDYEGSQEYWEALQAPEKYDAARADEIATRRGASRFAILTLAFGLLLQGGCWRFVLSDDYNEYGVIPILLSGLAGLWALQIAVAMGEELQTLRVRRPRIEIDEAIAYEQERLRQLKSELIRELIPGVKSWFEHVVEGTVRAQYNRTTVLGDRLSEMKRQVALLHEKVAGLVERELADESLWEKPDSSRWNAAAARLARELLTPLERMGYQINSEPNLTRGKRYEELLERLRRIEQLRLLKAKQAAERAWQEA